MMSRVLDVFAVLPAVIPSLSPLCFWASYSPWTLARFQMGGARPALMENYVMKVELIELIKDNGTYPYPNLYKYYMYLMVNPSFSIFI